MLMSTFQCSQTESPQLTPSKSRQKGAGHAWLDPSRLRPRRRQPPSGTQPSSPIFRDLRIGSRRAILYDVDTCFGQPDIARRRHPRQRANANANSPRRHLPHLPCGWAMSLTLVNQMDSVRPTLLGPGGPSAPDRVHFRPWPVWTLELSSRCGRRGRMQ